MEELDLAGLPAKLREIAASIRPAVGEFVPIVRHLGHAALEIDILRREKDRLFGADLQLKTLRPKLADCEDALRKAEARCEALDPCRRELARLVRLLEPLERSGRLDVPGLATLNGARAALAKAGDND